MMGGMRKREYLCGERTRKERERKKGRYKAKPKIGVKFTCGASNANLTIVLW